MLQTHTRELFAETPSLPEIIVAPRTDPIYNAHGYLTKVPVDAILPFIEQYTQPGHVIVDMFAGSGMTAVAAKIAGRSAVVSDISVLGQHIAHGYLGRVNQAQLRVEAVRAREAARARVGHLYTTRRHADSQPSEVVRTIWSFVYECRNCKGRIVYYDALAMNDWTTPRACPHCRAEFERKNSRYLGDVPVVVVTRGSGGEQVEQPVGSVDLEQIETAKKLRADITIPSVRIDPAREMYRRSALKKWRLQETAQFFADRNALALKSLYEELAQVKDTALRGKLLFVFTAILARASRRYQWSRQRPLNAANQNYYIAPVFYEWNVFELFDRKLEAVIRSDVEIESRSVAYDQHHLPTQQYVLSSADDLSHLRDDSVDYVFTDPPFGSNIFYSDMNLFHEAWLEKQTDNSSEAVIHTDARTRADAAVRYAQILANACREAFRILKPGAYMSMVFGNSSGSVWSIVQKALGESGFDPVPAHLAILDKGQRSVKGLNSGREGVITLDLIVTVRKPRQASGRKSELREVHDVAEVIEASLVHVDLSRLPTPSHVYLRILQAAMAQRLPLDKLHYSDVLVALRRRGYGVNPRSGHLARI